MDEPVEILQNKLASCRDVICTGYTSATASDIQWLDSFCADFSEFSIILHKFLVHECANKSDVIENIFLCLTQITTCIRHMEKTIKSEETGGFAISASRQHFLDRILWCMERIKTTINLVHEKATIVEESNFVNLMDKILEDIAPFSSFNEATSTSNVAEDIAEAMFASKQIRSTIDMILSHTLAFANVTSKNDKKIISVLCQKTIRDCISFQEECSLSDEKMKINENDRKLKAMSLENSLYQLEDYINESLLRLVFTTFLDYSKLSIQKLRHAIRVSADDFILDEMIADFDVNVDRTTQIGVFAIAFAPNVQVRNTVRSCLASLESLDSCIIPSLQSNCDVYSEILEQHFNEEVDKFKLAIQEIIDSNAFCSCYLEILSDTIPSDNEIKLNRDQLTDVLEMGNILKEHLLINQETLKFSLDADKQNRFEKFILMLEECQAIISCLNQVEPERVIKRFKILRSVLSKLRDSLVETKNAKKHLSDIFATSDEQCESDKLLESVGISPSTSSILYRKDVSYRQKPGADSLQTNYSKLDEATLSGVEYPQMLKQDRVRSVRRKESLRTTMFKRQKSNETESMYKTYEDQSTSLHITEILNQVTALSGQLSIAADN